MTLCNPENPIATLTARLRLMGLGDVIYVEANSREQATEVARGVTARKKVIKALANRDFTTHLMVAVGHAGYIQHLTRITCIEEH